jgi:nitric oxide dioxygenase
MAPAQVALVQASFARMMPIREAVARLFYSRLFEIDPAIKPLFAHVDMRAQGQKLMATIGAVVAGLSRPETVVLPAQGLTRRHVGYGAAEAQHAMIRAALLWTLRNGLGEAFTPEVEAAWGATLTLVPGVVVQAARVT